jgi:hypothetical protein
MGRNGLIEFLANAQMNRELYEDDAVTVNGGLIPGQRGGVKAGQWG